MVGRAIVDTGFLVALLNASDRHHAWASSLVPRLRGPWITAEACISEAVFLSDQVIVLSTRPATILETVEIDIARPRTYDAMATEHFGRLRDRIWRLIQDLPSAET